MSSLDEIRAWRVEKLNKIKEAGMEAYPVETPILISLKEVVADFNKLKKRARPFSVAGRILARREHGGSIFCDLYDGTAKLQAYFKKDDLGDKLFGLFRDQTDVGDFVVITGRLFLTKKNEKTLKANSWTMLSKSLRPLPEKWHGLQDVEERYRRRYLDLLMNAEIKERFFARSKIISALRAFLDENEYTEVETPMLQPLAGGATAIPFKTYHNALNADLFLRIAPELYLKKLLVGGLNRVYEIGRNFRNEGIDVTHNPEFTMLEFYEAYSDAKKQRAFVEKMLKFLVKKMLKKSVIEYQEMKIDFSKKFSVFSYFELLKKYALIVNPEVGSREDMSLTAQRLGVVVDPSDSIEKIMDNIYKKICRPKLIQPTFIVNYPVGASPFAKRHSENSRFIDRFQLVIGGLEMVNAFSELNDPVDQRERFLEQDRRRRAGEAEVSPSDEDYLEAMEYGMPPAGGVGLGIDRLIMLLTNTHNIREVILFPTLRPRE